jgi:deoxycytidylate deaminase
VQVVTDGHLVTVSPSCHDVALSYLEALSGQLPERTPVADPRFPDLVFGIVRPRGTEPSAVVDMLSASLAAGPYDVTSIETGNDRGRRSQALVALRAVARIVGLREQDRGRAASRQRAAAGASPRPRAWVIDGLMHPCEVSALREIYRRRFFAISCDVHLARDPALVAPEHREDVESALVLGDVFVRCDAPERAGRTMTTLVECILGHPFHTPTLDELGMAVAFQASLAAASLSRRVGAALMAGEQLLSIGWNEVPKAGGGVHHAESEPDGREFVHGWDLNDRTREEILADTVLRLGEVFTMSLKDDSRPPSEVEQAELLAAALRHPTVLAGKIFDIVEYGRTAHAEIVAITSAARRGIPVQDATLYTTTKPCHECLRAIVAAGISRVVYAEPYAKGRGAELLGDSVVEVPRHDDRSGRVSVEPFCGIGHHRFADLFSWVPRKQDVHQDGDSPPRGMSVGWDPREAGVRPGLAAGIFQEEDFLVQVLREAAALRRLEELERAGSATAPDTGKVAGAA